MSDVSRLVSAFPISEYCHSQPDMRSPKCDVCLSYVHRPFRGQVALIPMITSHTVEYTDFCSVLVYACAVCASRRCRIWRHRQGVHRAAGPRSAPRLPRPVRHHKSGYTPTLVRSSSTVCLILFVLFKFRRSPRKQSSGVLKNRSARRRCSRCGDNGEEFLRGNSPKVTEVSRGVLVDIIEQGCVLGSKHEFLSKKNAP